MRLKFKYKNWKKSKGLIFSPTLIKPLIISVTILIFSLLTWLLGAIYAQDKPDFVPKETRGAIRESIKENVAAPMAAVIPGVGNPFFNAAWTYKNNDFFTHSNNFGSDGPENKNWKTYKDDDLGFEIKYPEDFTVTKKDFGINIFNNKYADYQTEHPLIYLDIYEIGSTQLGINDWINNNKNIFIGDQDIDEVEGFLTRNPFKFGPNNGYYFDWIGMGETRNYVFYKNQKAIAVGVLGSMDNTLVLAAEDIIFTFK